MLSKLKSLSATSKAVRAYRNKRIELSHFPTFLWIEPTNRCNLECIICPNRLIPKHDTGFMEWDLFKKTVDEAKDFVSVIALYMRGEPLPHKDIFRMIEYIKQYNIRCMIHTNATLLNIKNAKQLIDSRIDYVSLSFDGYNKKTYESIRKKAKYEKVLDNILNLLREKKGRKSPYIALQTIITGTEEYGDSDLIAKEFYHKFSGLPINEINIKTAQSWGNRLQNTKEFAIPDLGKIYSPCPYLWAFTGVLWNGEVTPCCVDFLPDYHLGNVYNNSLQQIWNNKYYKRLRTKMIEQKYGEVKKNCVNCHMLWNNGRLLGLPGNLSRLLSIPLLNIFGFGAEKYMKRWGRLLNKSFSYSIKRK